MWWSGYRAVKVTKRACSVITWHLTGRTQVLAGSFEEMKIDDCVELMGRIL